MSDARPILYDWGPSPFCLKIRALLDYKGVDYERVSILGRPLIDVNRRGRVGKVPALELDGEMIVDSTDIALFLEARWPEPATLPADPLQRARCMALEDWADEALYFPSLYYHWVDPEGAPRVRGAFPAGPAGWVTYRAFLRRVRQQLVGQGTGRKPPAHIRRDLERSIATIEGLLGAGDYLLGDTPWLCDFAVLGQLVYLSRTPVGERALAGQPAIEAYLERMKALRER